MYTYEVTPDFKVNVYDPVGNLVDWPGPWGNEYEATKWAEARIAHLNQYGEDNENPV